MVTSLEVTIQIGPNAAKQSPLRVVCSMSLARFTNEDRAELHRKLDELLDQSDPANVRSIRVAAWDGIIKNADGEAEVVRQSSVRLESAQLSPAWPVVQPAAPVKVTTVSRPRRRAKREQMVAVVLPDPQIGFRYYEDTGEYDPFHDEQAIDVALQIVADLQPDLIIWLGDFLDLPEFGKYSQEPAFARCTQRAIDYGHELLARTRALAPRAVIRLLEGNHDARLQLMIARNAMAAADLHRAGDNWPVLSVPALLRLDELRVEYIGGYPSGETWINDRLKCIHGTIVRSGGSTARAVADDETVSSTPWTTTPPGTEDSGMALNPSIPQRTRMMIDAEPKRNS